MAPIKFEDNIKQKLENRRMQPSTDAWKSLQSKLESNDAIKSNKTYWWFGIAASLVGVLMLVNLLFNNKTKNDIETTIGNSEIVEPIDQNQIVTKSNNNSNSGTVENLKDEGLKQKTTNEKTIQSIPKKQLQDKQNQLIEKNINETLAQVDNTSEVISEKEESPSTTTLTFEDLKVQEVVAQINELNNSNQKVTDAEIEALLNRAEKEIRMQNIYDESTNTVDADALLQDVEADLEQSFRDRVFEALKSGYEGVKTAVVERNN